MTYNSQAWLAGLTESLGLSRGDFEIIVFDNHSMDGSAETMEAGPLRARVIRSMENIGFAAGNNRAAAAARGDFLVFLNPDTKVEPDWLVALLHPFEDSRVGLATSQLVLMARPDLLNACGNDVHISGLTLCRSAGRSREHGPEAGPVAAVSGAAFAIRRSLFEQMGGFNEGFFTYMEETALSLEAWLRGWCCVYAPGSVVHHDYALRFGPRKTLFQERNRYLMLLQLYRWPTLIVLLPSLLLAEAVTWGFVLARDRKRWTNKLIAYAQVLQHWSAMMARRRINRSQRTVKDRVLLQRTTWALDFGQVGGGCLPVAARLVFNPLFWFLRAIALLLVRW